MNVRKYKDSDLDGVNVILEEAFSLNKSDFSLDSCHEIVCEIDNVICGYLLLTKVFDPVKKLNYYLVDYVCTLSKYRGLGVGKALMKYAEEVAKDENASYLQLTCGFERVAAHRLYEECGFIKRDSDIFRKVLQ